MTRGSCSNVSHFRIDATVGTKGLWRTISSWAGPLKPMSSKADWLDGANRCGISGISIIRSLTSRRGLSLFGVDSRMSWTQVDFRRRPWRANGIDLFLLAMVAILPPQSVEIVDRRAEHLLGCLSKMASSSLLRPIRNCTGRKNSAATRACVRVTVNTKNDFGWLFMKIRFNVLKKYFLQGEYYRTHMKKPLDSWFATQIDTLNTHAKWQSNRIDIHHY